MYNPIPPGAGMNEDRLRESPKIEVDEKEIADPPAFKRQPTLVPRDFPCTVKQCPPGPFVWNENVYFKSAAGEIYMDNGRVLPGRFNEIKVTPAKVEWFTCETPKSK
jgi:hypothetical protein